LARYTCPFCYRVFKDDPHGLFVSDTLPSMSIADMAMSETSIFIGQCPDCKAVYVDITKGKHEDYGYMVHDVNGWYRPGDHHPRRYVRERLGDAITQLLRELEHSLWKKRMKRSRIL